MELGYSYLPTLEELNTYQFGLVLTYFSGTWMLVFTYFNGDYNWTHVFTHFSGAPFLTVSYSYTSVELHS
jgi:hypothetical protein